MSRGGAKIDRGDRLRNRGADRLRAFISAARRSNSDLVTGQAHRSTNGSASSNNTPFVDEKASGPAVDDNVVARCNKEPQISTNLNRASGRPLTGKHLKTDLLRYFAWGVWGSIPHCCKAVDSTVLRLDLLPMDRRFLTKVATPGAPLGGTR